VKPSANDGLHLVTPLWLSEPLSDALGEDVWLKMDCFQTVGSFKQRGMGRMCQEVVAGGAAHIVSSSGGNAGYATAYAARELGVSCLVVVPSTTSEFMRERIRSLGAEVTEHGASWDDAHAHAVTLAQDAGTACVHPFDHEAIWEGHSSVIAESAVQGPKPGVIVVAVGGGGLLCGVLEGMHRVGWNDVPVVAVETTGAASFHAAVEAGRLVTLDEIRSLATTLGARTVTPKLMEWKERHEIVHWIPTDRQAVRACWRFLDDHRVLVEPACGAALAAVYERCSALRGRGPVLVEVCGGAGVSLALLERWTAESGAA
jgi:L-serine/L-threonine ammonia-lyase